MQSKHSTIPEGYLRVTQVLRPFSTLTEIDPVILANAADRGTRVHAYCESYALGLFVTEVDADCKNYFEAFKRWFDEMVVDVFKTEMRLNSPRLRVSGAFDMVVLLKGDDELSLIDIKTPATSSLSWQLQTAAYQLLAREQADIHVKRRICLMLPKHNDKIKLVEYADHLGDQRLFVSALELYRFFNG